MHMIHAYMRAQKFPRILQQKVHKYFKRFYEENTSLDAKAILNDLDPKLREEVGLCLIEQSLLKNYLFVSMAESSLCKLPVIFKLSIFETGRYAIKCQMSSTRPFTNTRHRPLPSTHHPLPMTHY
jgi:hypothetical protein